MLKFQFARMSHHESPVWEHNSLKWDPELEDATPDVSQDVWDWMCGGNTSGTIGETDGVDSEIESKRLNASYAIVSAGKGAVERLAGALRIQSLDTVGETTAKTQDNAHGTNPTPSTDALALSHAGDKALPALTTLLDDDVWWIRAVAANMIYRIGPRAESATGSLVQ